MDAVEERPKLKMTMRESDFPGFWMRYGSRVVSPGGAASIAGTSRAAIYTWVERGHVRAWEFRRGEVYVHIGDVVQRAYEGGFRDQKFRDRWRRYLEDRDE